MNYTNEIAQNKDRFIQELVDWLKIPSVSADPKFKNDVLNAANYLAEQFKKNWNGKR